MRKLFCLFLLISSLVVAGSVKAEYLPMAGDLIKTADFPAVYIIDDNLRRHSFGNEATFWTWYSGGWATQKLKIISQVDFDSLLLGKNVTARPGAKLLKFTNSNKIYAVTPGGILCEIRALYGDDWSSRSIVLPGIFEADYVRDNSCIIISTSKYPDGSLIQYVKSKDVYYITGGKKRKISTAAITANGFHTSAIISNVPVSMVYVADKAITAVEYSLGLLSYLSYQASPAVTSRPDFIISDIVFPASRIVVNTPIQIQLIIRNAGGDATSELGLRNIVFNGQNWSTSNISHGSYPSTISPLGNSNTFVVTYTGRFVSTGENNFTAKVNEPSEVTELSTTNNSLSKAVTVYSY